MLIKSCSMLIITVRYANVSLQLLTFAYEAVIC